MKGSWKDKSKGKEGSAKNETWKQTFKIGGIDKNKGVDSRLPL
jgi:hypothetical protein